MKRARPFLVALGLSLGLLTSGAQARAHGMSGAERARLSRGATVAYPVTLDDGAHRHVGGITYTVVSATPAELAALFDDEAAYQRLLPRTKEAKVTRDGSVRHVAMRTGNALWEGVYTLFIEQSAPNELRFWLDPRAPHDLEDAYGYFRFEELGAGPDGRPRTLLTYAIAIDLGPGLMRDLFEEKVRAASLGLPQALASWLSNERPRHPGPADVLAAR